MAAPKRGLGRGFEQLLQRTDEAPEAESGSEVPDTAHLAEIKVTAIRPNPQQPRTEFDEDDLAELSASIAEIGVLQPVVVRPLGKKAYELVMGERRWRATQAAGLATIPAIVRRTEDHDLLRDALLENLHRAQLNPLEEAAAYQQMLDDFGCTQDELSRRIKRSRPQISNTLRLLRLPVAVQRRVAAGVLSAGHARALLTLDDPAAIERMAQRIVAEGLSVRSTEELVSLGGAGERDEPRQRRARRSGEWAQGRAERLVDALDTTVRIDGSAKRGRIVIEFASEEDLDRLLGLIDPHPPQQ